MECVLCKLVYVLTTANRAHTQTKGNKIKAFKWTGHCFKGRYRRQRTQMVTGSFSLFQAVIGGGAGGEKEGSHLGFLFFA